MIIAVSGWGFIQKPPRRHAPTCEIVPPLGLTLFTAAHAHIDIWVQAQIVAFAYIRMVTGIWPIAQACTHTLFSHMNCDQKKARTKYGQDRSFYQESGVNRLTIENQKKAGGLFFFQGLPTNGC
ncbi:hypothetical protein TU82_22740 [Pseudomonas orientalis]|nr:hypothetical protein TU82_22740 [Pseudomonas orientalis]